MDKENFFKPLSLGFLPWRIPAVPSVYLASHCWTEKGLGLCCAVFWIHRVRHRDPAPTGLLWQGREWPGQACDSSTLSPAFSALSSILDTWLEQYSEDFCQPPFFPCLKLLLSYLVVYMPGSEYEHRVLFLLDQWQHLEPRVTDGKCEETGECGEG